jgi:hypothetical protein
MHLASATCTSFNGSEMPRDFVAGTSLRGNGCAIRNAAGLLNHQPPASTPNFQTAQVPNRVCVDSAYTLALETVAKQ